MNHGTAKTIKSGCKCFECRRSNAERVASWRSGKLRLVKAEKARQMLLTFDSSVDAVRMLKLPYTTINEIRTGRMKWIRKQTEQAILRAA